MHRNLMVVGTSSGAGKSISVAALCRIFYKNGFKTAPFKSQNMSLNSFITKDGKEMGRAQVVQALACNTEPESFMNPILLKPTSDSKSQVILHGKSIGNMEWPEFSEYKRELRGEILSLYNEKIRANYDVCILEGAGSPVEINMTELDIVNMGMAELVDAPVLLVADIDRGGVFASIYGTIMLMPERERKNVKGVIINKFRGDIEVLKSGLKKIEDMINIPILGVIPHFDIDIEDEDGFGSKMYREDSRKEVQIKISIIKNGHISNFNDFDPFNIYPDVRVKYVTSPEELDEEDIIIIPGTKNSIDDYIEIKKQGLTEKIKEMSDKGSIIIGVCGGLQMLGTKIRDPYHIETELEEVKTLGLLPIVTVMEKDKKTIQFHGEIPELTGIFKSCSGMSIEGYEIHQGVSKIEGDNEEITFIAKDNIFATYIHGIFDNKEFTDFLLNSIREKKGLDKIDSTPSFKEYRDIEMDKLEAIFRANLNIQEIYKIMNLNSNPGKEKIVNLM